MAIDQASHLYISQSGTTNGNKISFIDLNDTNPVSSDLFTNLNTPTTLKLYNDYLYVCESSATVNRISRANIGLATLPVMMPYINGLITPRGLDVINNTVFVGDYGSFSLKKINTSTSPFQITTLINDLATSIILDGAFFYYTNPIYGKVYSNTIINPSTPSVELVTGILNPSSILLHNSLLYISDSTNGKIYRANILASSTVATEIITGLNQPQSMIVFNNYLYIAESGANRIVKFNLASLSSESFEDKFSVILSPNPTQNILNIQTQEAIKEVAVYDMLGKKITVNQILPFTIDVSNLAQGMYIIRIKAENDKIFSSKFLKK